MIENREDICVRWDSAVSDCEAKLVVINQV